MLTRTAILFFFVTALPLMAVAQTIELPDSLFRSSSQSGSMGIDGIELPMLQPEELIEPLFVTPPATTFREYIEAPAPHDSPLFMELPEVASEFFLHVILLHLSKIDIPGLDEQQAAYRTMLENFYRNLYSGGNYSIPYVPAIANEVSRASMLMGSSGGSGVVVSGCLDPLEAYRRYIQKKRMERARQVIDDFEDNRLPTIEEQTVKKLTLPNLLQETNFDVKVKKDGDNPPFRP